MTVNAEKEYILLIGTESGRIKIYGLANNERKGIVWAHDKVVGFMAWDGSAFISAGAEGRVHIWLWKPAALTTLGAAVTGGGAGFGGVSSFGGVPSTGMPLEMPAAVPGQGMPGSAMPNPGMSGAGFGGMMGRPGMM